MPDAGVSGRSSLVDAIGTGTLTRLVPRELVDEVLLSAGRKEISRNKLPARVMVYFVMGHGAVLRGFLRRGNAEAGRRAGLHGNVAAGMGNAQPGRPVPCERHDQLDRHMRRELAASPAGALPGRLYRVIDRVTGHPRSKNAQRHQISHSLPDHDTSLRHDQRSCTGPASPDSRTPETRSGPQQAKRHCGTS
jgi:Insertion element 4 transposase N-terminal